MQLLCKTLLARGCARIGLAIPTELDKRVNFHFSGAFAAVHFEAGLKLLPLFRDPGSNSQERVRRWYRRVSPDAIVTGSSWEARRIAGYLGLEVPGPVAFAAAGHLNLSASAASGIDELPEEVGAKAAERLSRKILHGEKGLPRHPVVTMIQGVWHDGLGRSLHDTPAPIGA